MSIPKLPARVSKSIDRISPETWSQLLECIEYAMNNPRGDGRTIVNTLAGLTARGTNTAGGGSVGVAVAAGESGGYFTMMRTINSYGEVIYNCFDSVNPESNIAGYVCVGAERIPVPVKTFYNPKSSSVCVVVSLQENVPNEVTGMSYSYTAYINSEMNDAPYGVNKIKIGRFVGEGLKVKYYRESDLKIVGYV